MAPESIWPGMFQAEHGIGTARVRSTRAAISDTVASYAISDEQGEEKRSRQPAMNRCKQANMGRKTIIVLLVGLSFILVRFTEAQQPKVARIGVLSNSRASDPGIALRLDAFRQGLRDLGYFDGKNINMEYRYAEGKNERLPELAQELVRLKVDVLVVPNDLTARAAKKATTTIPIVMTSSGNPIGTGVIASLARPGGNVTGVTSYSAELLGKRLALLKEVLPKISRFAFLYDAGSEASASREAFKEAQGVAKALGVQFKSIEVKAPNPDFEGGFQLMAKERVGALITSPSPLISLHRKKILELVEKNRIPAMHSDQDWPNAGGLMSYGANRVDLNRRAAVYVDKILKGAKPADLPVEQPLKFEFIINLKAAKALNLMIPQSVLFRADKVIK
jgi:putative tryptophan/tyrosine transport system substrate-binding protein